MTEVILIAAMAKGRVIGRNGALPWHIPEDMRYFKDATSGKPIIMGRRTYESIGRLLPDRINIIVTRQAHYKVDGAVICNCLDQALAAAASYGDRIMVIGGGEIYRQALPYASTVLLTQIKLPVPDGDTVFPWLSGEDWELVEMIHGEDATDDLDYAFCRYERKNPECRIAKAT